MNQIPVRNLVELKRCADARLAVVVPSAWCWRKPRPAQFVINLSGTILHALFLDGMFIYQKPFPTSRTFRGRTQKRPLDGAMTTTEPSEESRQRAQSA